MAGRLACAAETATGSDAGVSLAQEAATRAAKPLIKPS